IDVPLKGNPVATCVSAGRVVAPPIHLTVIHDDIPREIITDRRRLAIDDDPLTVIVPVENACRLNALPHLEMPNDDVMRSYPNASEPHLDPSGRGLSGDGHIRMSDDDAMDPSIRTIGVNRAAEIEHTGSWT